PPATGPVLGRPPRALAVLAIGILRRDLLRVHDVVGEHERVPAVLLGDLGELDVVLGVGERERSGELHAMPRQPASASAVRSSSAGSAVVGTSISSSAPSAAIASLHSRN